MARTPTQREQDETEDDMTRADQREHDREERDRDDQPAQAPRRRPQATKEQQEAQRKRDEADKELLAANSIGAQVILDYNEEGSLGARGGAGRSIEENTMARDKHLAELGLDPAAPTGPPPTAEAIQAKREEDAQRARDLVAGQQPGGPQQVNPKASRVSSLAAGIVSGNAPEAPKVPITPED